VKEKLATGAFTGIAMAGFVVFLVPPTAPLLPLVLGAFAFGFGFGALAGSL